jgi:hypothetical protein
MATHSCNALLSDFRVLSGTDVHLVHVRFLVLLCVSCSLL